MAAQKRQYITFRLSNELFAIDVGQVREVLELTRITRLPTAPAYMRGVINVRGQATPVVDLRRRLGLPENADTVHTRIMVIELNLGGEATVLGGIADQVHEVIEVDAASLEPPPRIASRWRTEFIVGMLNRDAEFMILLDVNAIFSSDESLLKAIGSGSVSSECAVPVEGIGAG